MTGIGPLLDESTPEVTVVFDATLELVRGAMPGATEQLDLPDRLVAFGFRPLPALRAILVEQAARRAPEVGS